MAGAAVGHAPSFAPKVKTTDKDYWHQSNYHRTPAAVNHLRDRKLILWPDIGLSPDVCTIIFDDRCVYFQVRGSRSLLIFNDVQARPGVHHITLRPNRSPTVRPGPQNREIVLRDGLRVRLASIEDSHLSQKIEWRKPPHASCDSSPAQHVFDAVIEH